MEHHFNVAVAKQYGVDAAVLLHNIVFWTEHNAANGKHLHDGRAWTFNSATAFVKLFPYLSVDRVKRALKVLSDADLILTGNFNQNAYDRTNWYAVTDKVLKLAIVQQRSIDSAPALNPSSASAPPIPDINTDKKPDTSDEVTNPTKAPRRVSTSRQRLAAHLANLDHCPADWANHASRSGFNQADIDREWGKFVDHHTARGNVMADWFAAWRTWCRNAVEFAARDRNRGSGTGQGSDGNLAAAMRASVASRYGGRAGMGGVAGQGEGSCDAETGAGGARPAIGPDDVPY